MKLVAAAAFALLSAGAASAGIVGDSIHAQYFYPDESSLYDEIGTAVVTAGGVDLVYSGYFTLHLSDNQIVADSFQFSSYWNPSLFNGLILTNLSNNFPSGYMVDGSTNMVGFSASNVSITGNQLKINWNGLSFDETTRVALSLSAVARRRKA